MPMLEGSVVIEPTTGVALVQLGAAGEVFHHEPARVRSSA
jgi:hypothetical protein